MDQIKKDLEQARARRLATMQACHKDPNIQELVDADNGAQQLVHELELKLRTLEEQQQYKPAAKPAT